MKLILTNGFLGSGKTTAIVHACQQLVQQGKKVGVITNDQGDQQVDSVYLKSLGFKTKEVSNGCFCCRYDELSKHIQAFNSQDQPDLIFAESVGSCTDLVATVLKPLAQFNPEIQTVVSVFADASLLASLIEGDSMFLDDTVRYIYKKQLEEADMIVVNKIDLVDAEKVSMLVRVLESEYPDKFILHQNSLDIEDVSSWITAIMNFRPQVNRNSLLLDYDVYGAGEAQLAWLDTRIVIEAPLGNGSPVVRYFIRTIFNKLRHNQLPIGHLKFFLETDAWNRKISFTMSSTSGDVKLPPADVARLLVLINARVQTDPELLAKMVAEVLTETQTLHHCKITTVGQSAFRPGYPQPTYRVD